MKVLFVIFWVSVLLCLFTSSVSALTCGDKNRTHSKCRIFLDHGGFPYHAEVFYPVAVILSRRQWPNQKLTFIVDKSFAEKTGLAKFWKKHASEGILGKSFRYELHNMPLYSPVWECSKNSRISSWRGPTCSKRSSSKMYHARVLITISQQAIDRLPILTLRNKMRFIMLVHHGEKTDAVQMLQWKNSILIGKLATHASDSGVSYRSFTPSHLSISPEVSSQCLGDIPVAIIQGSMSNRRDFQELHSILETAGSDMVVKLLTRSKPDNFSSLVPHVQWLENLEMTEFHEAFQGASFLLPGLNPTRTPGYFNGHPSSNIAYSIHFGLQMIGHEAIPAEYLALGGRKAGFWHNGSVDSIKAATREAIASWRNRCEK